MKLPIILTIFGLLCSLIIYGNENDEKFVFGSYGRIGLSSNLEGGKGEAIKIVANSTRLEKSPYQEIYFTYDFTSFESSKDNMKVSLNFAMAFNESMFHYNGKFVLQATIRNFYLNIHNLFLKNLTFWIGSRMYRGDDIYLLDFWPLDNLNTLGAGIKYNFSSYYILLHTGVNSVDQGNVNDPYQLLYYTIPLRDKIGTRKIVILNRQRQITSLKFKFIFDKFNLNSAP